ncbi:Cytochrome c oxidase polypeptide 5,mitochondrial [Wickerhamomyces ciferrii]|uniref:Cytochrome c oxidase polypeptide 5,mitochondrial n=1 Tax=Wickerhamomyces ciferrii (strain ATCC 14091 / BCRC 22168 / CBS 111 / JCM 3599 / NBRC 0793 / NRRL Y-1031 F-60-10) TaxID=1206466 RepID=K0KEW1_WICCF|nr:Cytochrome c oxidase polypeptide 5,mitochondrial [Wickerhamomyces ciferrii]CCH43670.1 Cytochrome c oxidase polypeptide 5,mitochondrial [Wickerhamomyces ciferrii]
MLRSFASTSRNVARINPVRLASTHAVSNASIVEIEKRWESLPSVDQQDIVSQLAERQKLPWGELTQAEKKAAWYISYGAWGPRRPIHPKGEAGKIATGVAIGLGVSLTIFATVRYNSPGAPKTMNREWQDQSDEYLKSKNANPWSSYSQVQ